MPYPCPCFNIILTSCLFDILVLFILHDFSHILLLTLFVYFLFIFDTATTLPQQQHKTLYITMAIPLQERCVIRHMTYITTYRYNTPSCIWHVPRAVMVKMEWTKTKVFLCLCCGILHYIIQQHIIINNTLKL